MPFGRLFFAIPLAVFGSEHFTVTANVATLVPRWIPAHTFWVYLVGVAFLCAALSIAVLVQARLAAASGRNDAADLRIRNGHASRRLRTQATDFFGPWP